LNKVNDGAIYGVALEQADGLDQLFSGANRGDAADPFPGSTSNDSFDSTETNPNSQSLNLQGYDYELWLEGKSVAQGVSQEPVSLPPQGQTVARVPILVKLPAVLGLLPLLLRPEPPPLHYQVAGYFRLSEVLGGLVRIPFRFQGQVTPKEGLEALRPYLR